MFIYNVTTKVSWTIHDAWVEWMLNEHMHGIINTHCFTHFQLLRLHEQDESEGPTYVAQYFAESKTQYNRYIELFARRFQEESVARWGDNYIAFRTLLEIVR